MSNDGNEKITDPAELVPITVEILKATFFNPESENARLRSRVVAYVKFNRILSSNAIRLSSPKAKVGFDNDATAKYEPINSVFTTESDGTNTKVKIVFKRSKSGRIPRRFDSVGNLTFTFQFGTEIEDETDDYEIVEVDPCEQ
jgi:hypothetical protein